MSTEFTPSGHAVSSDAARAHWSQTLDIAQREPVTITHRGRPRAVMVEPNWFARAWQALEDVDDAAAARAARTEDEPRTPHSALVGELGLDTEG
ncbi:MAG: type II toxin-antitoxin system Phd/YefM family antitoxin [Bifidobacteriaceae bacterium]|jgi:antitoxin (DNA-binding transcriptional repressor) of toxin-antitoxin stability system|nr:type II toxin-antitoxin system Phd/YefM family antitoxin [Bifidobacteriaceae bacterium]